MTRKGRSYDRDRGARECDLLAGSAREFGNRERKQRERTAQQRQPPATSDKPAPAPPESGSAADRIRRTAFRWSGTEEKPPSAAGQADAPPASRVPALVLIEEDKPAYIPDAAEVEALAKMLYGEARGVASDTEKAACVWCVLNRVDDPRFPDTVLVVVAAPYQFAGYSADYPVLPELERIAADVLTRYHEEKSGGDNVGRVLPAEYCFFTGDGEQNYFTAEWKSAETWGWALSSHYDD